MARELRHERNKNSHYARVAWIGAYRERDAPTVGTGAALGVARSLTTSYTAWKTVTKCSVVVLVPRRPMPQEGTDS
jgi:hypothetical protein